MRVPISIFILTFNEEKNLEYCLESTVSWASEVVIVDSFSTDGTLRIAEKYGAKVYQHKFESFGSQRNWALANIPFKENWMMTLDADHVVTPELAKELDERLSKVSEGTNGLYVRRKQIFWGRWIKHGGYYPKHLLKVFRKGMGKFDPKELDDRVYVSGKTEKLRGDIVEYNRKEDDISFFVEKHNRYAKMLAEEEFYRNRGTGSSYLEPKLLGDPNQRVHWLKQRWRGMPLYVRPILYFMYRYFVQLGFLDGKEGLIFHFLQGFWYRMLIDINIDQIKRSSTKRVLRRVA